MMTQAKMEEMIDVAIRRAGFLPQSNPELRNFCAMFVFEASIEELTPEVVYNLSQECEE